MKQKKAREVSGEVMAAKGRAKKRRERARTSPVRSRPATARPKDIGDGIEGDRSWWFWAAVARSTTQW